MKSTRSLCSPACACACACASAWLCWHTPHASMQHSPTHTAPGSLSCCTSQHPACLHDGGECLRVVLQYKHPPLAGTATQYRLQPLCLHVNDQVATGTTSLCCSTHLQVCNCMQVCGLEVPDAPVAAAVLHNTTAHKTSIGGPSNLQQQQQAHRTSCQVCLLWLGCCKHEACAISLAHTTSAS